LVQHTKTMDNTKPNDHKIYQMALKYTSCS
jgi:hypothetical protein